MWKQPKNSSTVNAWISATGEMLRSVAQDSHEPVISSILPVKDQIPEQKSVISETYLLFFGLVLKTKNAAQRERESVCGVCV